MTSFLSFVYSQKFVTLPYPNHDFSGQTVIVTGANTGLGCQAATHITRLNASKVVLGVRSLDKGNEAKRGIEESTGRTGVVEVWQIDLGSYESVNKFAQRAQGLQRLDVVVENAGIGGYNYAIAEDNESMITVNVISTFLLALMILPKLEKTATQFNKQSHLVVVTSEVHASAKFKERKNSSFLEGLKDKNTANMGERLVPSLICSSDRQP